MGEAVAYMEQVVQPPTNLGLAKSWFSAWDPVSSDERAIILEDDVELSPRW